MLIISRRPIIPCYGGATVEIGCAESLLEAEMIAGGNPRSAALTSYNSSYPRPQLAHASRCKFELEQTA